MINVFINTYAAAVQHNGQQADIISFMHFVQSPWARDGGCSMSLPKHAHIRYQTIYLLIDELNTVACAFVICLIKYLLTYLMFWQ